MKKNKRGQITVFDMLIAVLLFSFLVTVVMLTWYTYNQRLLVKLEREEAISKAIEITDLFVRTSGLPSEWNSTNVILIGLATSDRKISEDKAREFCNVSYDEARTIMNIPYHFYFYVSSYTPGVGWEKDVECGNQITEDTKKAVSFRRPVLYKDGLGTLGFILWR
jgi:hypothetical protein